MFILYSVVTIPLAVGFQLTKNNSEFIFDSFIDCLFLMDIIFTFNTSYTEHSTERVITDRVMIAKKYLELWFWIDFMSTIPFDTIIELYTGNSSDGLQTLRLIRILRLSRMLKLLRVMKLSRVGYMIEALNINPALFGVQKLIAQICFAAHIFCCFWFFVGLQGSSRQELAREYGSGAYLDGPYPNWIVAYNMHSRSLTDQYVASFYWTITTMLSIGYGDIHAYNSGERIYTIFIQLTGSILFGAVIAQVTRLIASRNPQAKAFKEKIDELKGYLNEKLLPPRLKASAKECYTYYLTRKSAFSENVIYDELPATLLNPLVLSIYSNDIHKISFFRHLDESFVVQLFILGKPFQSAPNTFILEKGDVPDELMFILRGVVQFSTNEGRINSVVGYNSDGGYFGDFEYFKRVTRLVSHKAIVSSHFISFASSDLDEIFKTYPNVKEQIMKEFSNRFQVFISAKTSLSSKIEGSMIWMKDKLFVNGELKNRADHEVTLLNSSELDSSVSQESDFICTIMINDREMEVRREELRRDVHRRFIVLPDDAYKVRWDLFIGMLIMFSVIVIPVQIGFSRVSSGPLSLFDAVTDSLFFMDMLVSARTAYFSDRRDAFITVPNQIYYHYFKTWFWIDFFSVVPFDKFFASTSGALIAAISSFKLLKVIRLMRLLKLSRIVKLQKYMTKIEDSTGINPASFELTKMMLQVIFVGHLICCVFWYLSWNMSTRSWIDVNSIRDSDLYRQYITTLYFTFTTVSTVGYGDIIPYSTSERVVVICIMIFGATIFGYIAANVSTLMGSMDISASRINGKISEVTEFLREKNASAFISKNIINHYKHKLSQSSAYDEAAILSRLPLYLCRKMIAYQHSVTLSHIAIFEFIESKGVVLFLFRRMTTGFYDKDHIIAKEGEMATEVIFFLTGCASVFRSKRFLRKTPSFYGEQRLKVESTSIHKKSHRQSFVTLPVADVDFVCDLVCGDFIGHMSLMQKSPYAGTVKAKIACSAYVLSEMEIAKIVRDFPAVGLALQGAFGSAIFSKSRMGKELLIRKRADFINSLKTDFVKARANEIVTNRRRAILPSSANLFASFRQPVQSTEASVQSRSRRFNSVELGSKPAAADKKGQVNASKILPIGSDLNHSKNIIKAASTVEDFQGPQIIRKCASYEGSTLSNSVGKSNDMNLQEYDEHFNGVHASEKSSDRLNVTDHSRSSDYVPAIDPQQPDNKPSMKIVNESNSSKLKSDVNINDSSNKSSNMNISKWSMVSAVVSDAASMAILRSNGGSSSEEKQEIETGKANVSSAETKLASENARRLKIYGPQESVNLTEPVLISQLVKRQINNKKIKKILVLADGNEIYDSDEEKKIKNPLYNIKSKIKNKLCRSCPNFEFLLRQEKMKARKFTKKRRLSFPSLDVEEWKERIQFGVIV
jgi:CRP-like cAMP-binding protein